MARGAGFPVLSLWLLAACGVGSGAALVLPHDPAMTSVSATASDLAPRLNAMAVRAPLCGGPAAERSSSRKPTPS